MTRNRKSADHSNADKGDRRLSRRQAEAKVSAARYADSQARIEHSQAGPRSPKTEVLPLVAKTQTQGLYMESICNNVLTFGVGPAGTGKTFLATAMAADMLKNGETKKLILTRPAVEAGENLGFLPGTMEEKLLPYMRPYNEVLNARLGKGFVEYALKCGQIEAAPLAFLRGWTFSDCVVILDEAQNTTPTQMKLFLTRIGKNVTVIVNGDPDQMDITGACGLIDGMAKASGLFGVGVVNFTRADVVRSGLVQDLIERYAKPVKHLVVA